MVPRLYYCCRHIRYIYGNPVVQESDGQELDENAQLPQVILVQDPDEIQPDIYIFTLEE